MTPSLDNTGAERIASHVTENTAPSSSSPNSMAIPQSPRSNVLPNNEVHEIVSVPPFLPLLSTAERARLLKSLLVSIQSRSERLKHPRDVLPLLVPNMNPTAYSKIYSSILASGSWELRKKDRYLWNVEGNTYLFFRPQRRTGPGFELSHGKVGKKNQELYSVWRLERHGSVKVWRYLGVLEMPSYRTARKFITRHMQVVPPPHAWPRHFVNDAAHLDPGQIPADVSHS